MRDIAFLRGIVLDQLEFHPWRMEPKRLNSRELSILWLRIMRIAYVGLSTPLFYDYRNPASKAPSDLVSSPNPILDSPFGLMLLFDEIWFLCRSLCPENMRELSYVRFLDERKMLPSLEIKTPDFGGVAMQNDPALSKRYERFNKASSRFFSSYQKFLKRAGVDWQAAPDNHTHKLQIGDSRRSANPVSFDNLLFDMAVVQRIERNDVELVTNSISQRWLDDSPFMKARLTELLTVENIPNYLTSKGPYHTCIEEARDNPFLRDFRKWITSQTIPQNEKELLQMKREIEAAIQKSEDEIFLKNLGRKRHIVSIGKTLVGAGGDLYFGVPSASIAISVAEEMKALPLTTEREGGKGSSFRCARPNQLIHRCIMWFLKGLVQIWPYLRGIATLHFSQYHSL